jgi:hypothetical protein
MNINSEKEMYGVHLHEEVANFNAEYFVWGEELFDKKLIVYSKKIKQIPGYDKVKDVLEPGVYYVIKGHEFNTVAKILL